MANYISELLKSRHLIWKLAKNDFKKKYAGSYMGVIWALVQPVVTIGMYYIVFDKILGGASRTEDAPFVLFLTAGLVPWFFFNEALNAGTGALREYDYLVKKVVFRISTLPVIKIIGTCFVHAFFVFVLLVVALLYGYYPSVYMLQLVYYSLCCFMITLAVCYTTSAVVVFFKDLTQIITICLQLGMWATPILWDIDILSPTLQKVISINPLVYIVEGYRNAIYGERWFFQDLWGTIYFWCFTAVLFAFGTFVFKRLKPHFADVL